MSDRLLENNLWRKRLANDVPWMRSRERENKLVVYRTGEEYVKVLYGLRYLLDYVRNNSDRTESRLVLDLGAGITKGISQIAKSSLGLDIDFQATVLRRNPRIGEHLGFDKIHVTPFERLRGVKPNSVAAVISVFGLGYATSPEQAVERIDEVLCPSGVIKSNFQDEKYAVVKFREHQHFTEIWKQLGYDIATMNNPEEESVIVVAVKPPVIIPAKTILESDFADWKIQKQVLGENK